MSLTIRMKRALAAFWADPRKPTEPKTHVEIITENLQKIDEILDSVDTDTWKVHSDYHRSRIVMGHRLDWYTTKTGKRESAGYNGRMYYGEAVRSLFRSLGIKDRWT